MKLSRIIQELERIGIEPNYTNVAIYVEFVVTEDLIKRLGLNQLRGMIKEPEIT